MAAWDSGNNKIKDADHVDDMVTCDDQCNDTHSDEDNVHQAFSSATINSYL